MHRPRFSLGNYNLSLLKDSQKALLNFGLENFYIYHDKRKGTLNSQDYPYRHNHHTLALNKKSEMLKLMALVENEIKHKDGLRQTVSVKEWFKGKGD